MGQLKFDITGDNSNVLKAFRGVQDGVRQTAQIVEQQGQSIENVFGRIKSVASVAFAGFTAKEIVTTLANVRGEFQQLEIAFSTMLGSEQKAADLMKQLTNLAATTPFDMKGVASGAKSLLAYGFSAEEVTDTMRRLGDVCAGLGLNLQDMAWLYGTTRVQGRLFTQDFRQFTGRGIPLAEELAKQFGVTKDKVQELVTAGKVGFPEVQKAMESMTNEGGKFGGLMEKQSHSITGQISNIEDTIEMAINDMGKQTEGLMNDALDVTSAIIDHWKEVGEVILAAASSIGLYKAMAVGIASFESASSNVGYEAELSALQSILPLKEEEKKTDLEEAVAKGQLSVAQAELVATKREEAAAYVDSLKQEALAAQQAYTEAQNRAAQAALEVDAANEKVDACQEAYDAAERLGLTTTAETAEEALNTATVEANTAAKNLQAAREEVAAAAKAADTASTAANTAQQNLNTAATARDTAAKGLWAQVTILCKRAQDAWNASMFSSPLFWIAAAIAGATYAVYKLVTAETAQEAAIRKSNEAWEEFDKKVQERQSSIESLIRTIQSETSSEYEKAEAYQKLTALAPQLTEKYDQTALASLELSKAQKEVSESMDDEKYQQAIQNVEELRKKVESLSMTSQSVAGYTMGGSSNTRAYEKAQEELTQAENVLHNIITLRQQATENAKPIEVRLKEAQDNEQVRQEIFDFYDKAMLLARDWQAANEDINFVTGQSRADEFITETETELEEMRKQIKENPADINLRLKYEEKQKVLDGILDMKRDWKATGATTIPLIFKANWQTAQQSLNQAKSKASALANGGSTETYAQAYTKAQKEYREAQKKVANMQKNKSAYSATDYETASNNLKTAKDAFAKLGGDVSGKTTKTRNGTDKEENKKVRAQEELNKALKSLQQKNNDEVISLMQEGTEKKLKEIDNDYKKRIAEIDKQETEFKKKNKEAGKSSALTTAQSDALKQSRDLAKQSYENEIAKLNADQASYYREFLSEYGTYQQQRLAIAMKTAEKIKKVNESTDTDEQKQWQIAKIKEDQRKSERNIELEAIKQNIDWGSVFGEFGAMFKSQLQPTINKLQQLSKTTTDINEQKTIQELITKLEGSNTVWDSDIFKKVSDDINAYQQAMLQYAEAQEIETTATKNVADAEEELARAMASNDPKTIEQAQKLLKAAQSDLSSASSNVKTFGTQVEETSSHLQTSSKKAVSQFQQLESGLSGLTSGSLKGIGESILGLDKLFGGSMQKDVSNMLASGIQSLLGKDSKAAQTISKALGDSGMAGEIISAALGILDLLKDGISGIVSNLIDVVMGAVNGILSDVLSGKIVTETYNSLASGIGNILNTVTFGGFSSWTNGDSDKTLHEDLERLAKTNEELQKVMENLKDEMSDATIANSKNVYEIQKSNIESRRKNTQESMQRSANASSKGFIGFGSKASTNAKINEGMDADKWAKVSQAAGVTVRTAQEFFALSSEQMYNVAQYATDQYILLKDLADDGKEDAAQFMDTYIEYWQEAKETEEAYFEHLTTVSFDSVVDDFREALLDMDTDAEDFAENFGEYLQKAIVESMLVDKYKSKLEDWYKMFSSAMEDDGRLDKQEQSELEKYMQDEIVTPALAERDALKSLYDWESSSSGGQEATTISSSGLTEDTGKAIEGRFTAVQIATEDMKASVLQSVQLLGGIAATGSATSASISDIRNMMVMANSHLEDMVRYARLTYTDFGEKLENMYTQLKKL